MSRKLFCFIIWFLFASLAYPVALFNVGGGAGGSAEVFHLSFDLIILDLEKYDRDTFYAFDVSVLLNRNDVPGGLLDYSCPHDDYSIIGKRQLSNETAFIGKYAIEIIRFKHLFTYGLAGFSEYTSAIIAQSNASGRYYTQSDESTYHGIIGLGMAYTLRDDKNVIFSEFDNRRGITFGFGIKFF